MKKPSVPTPQSTLKIQKGGNTISTSAEALNVVSQFCDLISNAIKTCESEQTKREAIRAKRDIELEKIHQTADIIKTYLNRTFDERANIFNKQFEIVDEALRTGNIQMLELGLTHIHALAAQSPFKNLSDLNQVQKALLDENTVWDI